MKETIRFVSKPAREVEGVTVIADAVEGTSRPSSPFPVRFDSPEVEGRAAARWERDVAAFAARSPVPPRACYRIEDATCLWPGMVVVAPDNTIVRETASANKQLRKVPGFAALKKKQVQALARVGAPLEAAIEPPAVLEGDFFLLSSSIYGNYFHWLIECLPKIAVWRQTGEHRKLLCPPLEAPFHRQSLALAGVSNDRIAQPGGNVRTPGELLFSDRIRPGTDRISRSVIPFFDDLRTRVAATKERKRRLFVSRSGAKVRRLLNEDEVTGTLAPLGFEAIRAETLSFAEQMSLYAGAEIIVAPHGAGLANTAICHPGTVIVELIHDRFEQPGGGTAYAAIADFGGLRYGLVVGGADPDASGNVTRESSFDFRIRPESVLEMIEDLGGRL